MQVMKLFFVLTLFFLSGIAQAACSANKWSGPSEIEKLEVRDFLSMDRAQLYSNLYFELTQEKSARIPGLAAKLFHYLTNTENNEAKYKLLQSEEWAADLDKPDPMVFSLKELCSLDKKVSAYKGIAEDSDSK